MGFTGENNRDTFTIQINTNFGTGNSRLFSTFFELGVTGGSRPNRVTTMPFGFSITDVLCRVITSGKDEDSTFQIEDDGVIIHTTTVTAGVLAEFNTTGINLLVASGSQMNTVYDTSASTNAGGFFTCPLIICNRN